MSMTTGTPQLARSSAWPNVLRHRATVDAAGVLSEHRRQQVDWMWAIVEQRAVGPVPQRRSFKAHAPALEAELASGSTTLTGALELLSLFTNG
jgi:LAO/AO transport system kinase